MNKKFRELILIILTVLISRGIVYSQTNFWEPVNVPLSNSTIGAVAIASNEDVWLGYIGALYVSTDNCGTWIRKTNRLSLDSILVSQIAINPVNGYIFIIVSGPPNSLALPRGYDCYRSTDNGENWVKILDAKVGPTFFITPSGEIYYSLTGEGIDYSSDNGDTWINKSHGLPTNFGISSFALGGDGTLYVGGYTGDGGSVYRSTNGGNEWLLIFENKNTSPAVISSIDGMTIAADGSIFLTTDKYVLKSTDKGITWNKTNVGISNPSPIYTYVRRIIYNPITGHIILSCSYSGIYRSTDLGVSWHQISNKLEGVGGYYTPIVVNSTTGMMFVLVGNCLYRSTDEAIRSGQVVSVEEPEEIPTTYSLLQNYPNPFNPTTTIQYSIPKDEFVKLTVYDVSGKVIKELVSGHKAAGSIV